MNIKRDKHTDDQSLVISDKEARLLLASEQVDSEEGLLLVGIAKNTADIYSFVDHQTYPRPHHPHQNMRLSPEFTYVAIITSLRCTLETEQRVVRQIINTTRSDISELISLESTDLENILKPAGMAKQKSAWIKEGLDIFRSDKEYNIEVLRSQPIEEARQKLLKLKGMGPKAVDCYLLLGLDLPVFPVDVNVFNIVARHFPKSITGSSDIQPSFANPRHVSMVKQLLESIFRKDTKLYQVLHTYLLLARKYNVYI
jgi:endonuclease III